MNKSEVVDASKNGRMKIKDTKTSKFLADLVTHTKYAGYIPHLERRQSWDECIDELMAMHKRKYPKLSDEIDHCFNNFVRPKHVLPSMRSVQFGGIPIEFAPNRIYNCSYAPCEDEFIFAELLFLLLGGTGTGYSVRKRHVKKLPMIKSPDGERRFMIGDSIEGWSDSMRQLTYAYMRGKTLPLFDYRDIRPKGSIIKKTGGRAPGPSKLIKCHENIKAVFDQAIGRRLVPLEVHDICCFLADCVLAGGVREAAMISIFDLDNINMITAKGIYECEKAKLISEDDNNRVVKFKLKKKQIMDTRTYGKEDRYGYLTINMTKKFGDCDYDQLVNEGKLSWFYVHPQRSRANNSAALRRGEVKEKQFRELWKRTEEAKSGDPGILWVNDDDSGTNPCGEIALNPYQFCNLTTAVVYDVKSQAELNERVRMATFIGTLQAGHTNFHYLRPIWQDTTEKEALLGVSMTGIASGAVLEFDLKKAAKVAIKENERIAKKIGINPAARLTCVKPEGTGTLAAGIMGNGIHSMYGKFIIRSNRIKKHDPTYSFLKEIMPDFIEDEFNNEKDGAVIAIPLRAPNGSITRSEPTIDMLNRVKRFSEDWVKTGHRKGCNTHNVSATVFVRPDEWDEVADWMWKNRTSYNGLTCLGFDGGNYKQAPFQEIDEDKYHEMMDKFPEEVDFTQVKEFNGDAIDLQAELACSGGACSI